MRILSALSLVCLLAGCPQRSQPPPPTTTQTKDYQNASEAVGERLKPGSGLPTDPAVKAIQRGLQQNEQQQQRAMKRADEAGAN